MNELAQMINELEKKAKEIESFGKDAGITSDNLGLASVLTAIQITCEGR